MRTKMAVHGDLGAQRAAEMARAFPKSIKKSGSTLKNPFKGFKPKTGIDAKFGPGDVVS